MTQIAQVHRLCPWSVVEVDLEILQQRIVDFREIQYTSLQEGFKSIQGTLVVLGALQRVLRYPILSEGEEIQCLSLLLSDNRGCNGRSIHIDTVVNLWSYAVQFKQHLHFQFLDSLRLLKVLNPFGFQ